MSDSPAVIIYGSDGYGGYEEKGTTNPLVVDGYGTAGTPRGGVISVQGVSGGQNIPISGSVTATQSTGTNLHTVIDSGSVTATQATGSNLHTVIDSGAVTVSQATASNLNANVSQATGSNLHTVVDSGSITATQATGSNLHMVVDSGSITATQSTASNLKAQVEGPGIAGTPAGGVLSIQGVSGGQAVPISGSVTATNASVGTDNSTKPGSDTLIGGSDGTNLQAVRVFDADSGGGTQYVLGVSLRKSSSGGSVELGTSGDPIRTDPTGSTAQPVTDNGGSLTVDGSVTVSQATGTNLHAVIDSGSITATQATGSNLHAVVDSGSITATQATGSNLHTVVDSGAVTVSQATASNLNANVSQATASNLNATVVQATGSNLHTVVDSGSVTATQGTASNLKAQVEGPGIAGTPSGGVLSVQGVSGGQAIPITGSVSTSVIPNPSDTTGTIGALNGVVSAAIQGYSSCGVVLTGTWTAGLVFEMSSDGGTTWTTGAWITAPASPAPVPGLAIVVSTNGSYGAIGMGPHTHVRVRAAAYTSGTVNVRLVFADNPPVLSAGFSTIQQNVSASIYNSSTTNIAAGASFTGGAETTLGIAGIQVSVKADQPILVEVQQGPDGTNWDVDDEQIFLAGQGDARTFQAVGSYFRVVATNLGTATTTYFRLQISLCPVVEAVPRALTPHGKLKISSQTTSYTPDPYNFQDLSQDRALLMDVERNLNVRARCLTDETSYRDDFTSVDSYGDLTGTVTFTNGSNIVIGVGTSFLSETNKQLYIKLSTDDDGYYNQVGEVLSDEFLQLSEPYQGTSGSGTGRGSYWIYTVGSGGSITQTGSEILLASGTTSGTVVEALRWGDYLPYTVGFKARITQRIANQEAHIGLADGDIATMQNQALVVFDGTTNTTIKLRTSSSSSDVETTTITLPDSAVSSTSLYYQLEVTVNRVILFINDVKVAEHKLHIPGPYALMDSHICIANTGTAGSTTTLAADTYFLTNFDRVEISTTPKGDPISTKELRSSVSSCTNVSAAVANTTLLAPNPNRLGASIYNDSVATLYLKLGASASSTSYTIALGRYDYYEVPANYVGRINGYWSAATGTARITELS